MLIRARLIAPACRLVVSACCLVVLAGCSSKDPVQALLDDVIEATEDRDAHALADLLTDDVSAGGMDKNALAGTLRQYLAAYQALDVSFSDIESVRRGGSAQVKLNARMTGVPQSIGGLGDLVPQNAKYHFDLTLRETPEGWKISQVDWQEL